MTNQELQKIIWAAGFIDGEGCIRINSYTSRKSTLYNIVLKVSQKKKEPLEILVSLFGGKIGKYGQRNIYQWQVTNKMANEALKSLLPYLILKKEQAELALSFQERRISRKLFNPEQDKIDKNRLKELKR